jgi:hypothetical protein
METTLIRELYGYHHWANRRLVEELGAEAAARDMGKPWSFPTLTRMFGHIYGADWLWLQRFKGVSVPAAPAGNAVRGGGTWRARGGGTCGGGGRARAFMSLLLRCPGERPFHVFPTHRIGDP